MSTERDGLRLALVTHYWDHVRQRFHHWYDQANRHGHRVTVFTVPPPRRAVPPASASVRRPPRSLQETLRYRLGDRSGALRRQDQRLERLVQRELLDAPAGTWDGVLYSSVPSLLLERRPASPPLVYDCMDNWAGFPGLPADIAERERRLVAGADLVLAATAALAERWRDVAGNRAILVPNGCEYELFAAAAGAIGPRSLGTQPVLGYVGTIHEWFDWQAITALARAMPSARVRLVGPAQNVPADLPPNVELAGRRPYTEVPAIVAGMDVCLIPFRDPPGRSLLDGISPIKLYEYLAAGRPVVSALLSDAVALQAPGVVHLAGTPAAYVAAVATVLETAWRPEEVARRQSAARAHSWDSRWQAVEPRLRKLAGR